MPKLSDSLIIKNLKLKNRLIMAPVLTGLAIDNAPSKAQIEWYKKRALGGVSMIIVESCSTTHNETILPLTLGIWDDAQIPGMATLANAIKDQGLPAILQINHGGARSFRKNLEQERIGPSAVKIMPGPSPRAMTESEIISVIKDFAKAASRAVEAGFDGIEIQAAHYYLISQFLSPYTNHRTDYWGGNYVKRANLVIEVVKAVRQMVGKDYPIFCRINSVEYLDGGIDTDDMIFTAKALEAASVDVIDASGIGSSSIEKWHGLPFLSVSSILPKGYPERTFTIYAGHIRKETNVPIIAVSKVNELDFAQEILNRGQADLIALARPLIADPTVANKMLTNMNHNITRCKECGSCFNSIRNGAIVCPQLM